MDVGYGAVDVVDDGEEQACALHVPRLAWEHAEGNARAVCRTTADDWNIAGIVLDGVEDVLDGEKRRSREGGLFVDLVVPANTPKLLKTNSVHTQPNFVPNNHLLGLWVPA